MSDARYEIIWCSRIPMMKECPDEKDIDNATYETVEASGFDEAITRAKQLLAKDCFGSVNVVRQEQRPHPTQPWRQYWADVADLYVDDRAGTYSPRDFRPLGDD